MIVGVGLAKKKRSLSRPRGSGRKRKCVLIPKDELQGQKVETRNFFCCPGFRRRRQSKPEVKGNRHVHVET